MTWQETLEDKLAGPPLMQLPSAQIELGQILATSGLISQGSVGDVRLSWHEYTTSRTGADNGAAVIYDVSVLPFEYILGAAAPQIAMPGRSNLVRSYLLDFLVFQDTTTSLSPASMETVDAGGIRGGYPAWIINEMIKLDIDPEAGLDGWNLMPPAHPQIPMTCGTKWRCVVPNPMSPGPFVVTSFAAISCPRGCIPQTKATGHTRTEQACFPRQGNLYAVLA